MNLRNISIRKRINIGFTLIIIISVFINIYLIIKIRQISQNIDYLYQHPFIVSNTTRELRTDFLSLYFSLMQINSSRDKKTLYSEKENIDRLNNDIESSFASLSERYLGNISDIQLLNLSFKKYKILEIELLNDYKDKKKLLSDSSTNNRLKLVINDLLVKNDVILQFSMNKGKSFHSESMELQHNILINTLILIGLSLLISILITFFIIKSISRPLKNIILVTQKMALGNLNHQIENSGNDEITLLMTSFENMRDNLIQNASIANKIASGDFTGNLEPKSDKDDLAIAINKMTKSLRDMTADNDRQTWIQQGQNELHEYIRGEQELSNMANNIITFICNYLNSKPGALYLLNNSDNTYNLVSSYAYTFRKGIKNKFKSGEGIVGQAALEQKRMVISDLPDNYMKINSALGDISPQSITVVPLIYQKKTIGIMELAHLKDLTEHELSFLDIIAESVAINFNMAINRNELKNLLEITQEQSELLRVKQEEMLQTNEELELQTKALKKSEEYLQTQQEELRVINEELEANSSNLKLQKSQLLEKNKELIDSQKEVERKASELERTSKYKSEFLANMSHELRTPLNSLLILSQDLINNQEGNLSQDQIESSTIIYKSGNDLLNLINEILDLSKIESGKLELNIQKTDISEILFAIKNSFKKQLEDKGIQFSTIIEPGIPAYLFTDIQRVDQIIKNLMSNALKFTPSGSINITVKRPSTANLKRLSSPIESLIAFCVSDTGIGISPEIQEKIFEAFQQADGSTSRKYGGTGLGLTISRDLAELLGGELTVISEQDKGAQFTLILPVNNVKKNLDTINTGHEQIVTRSISVNNNIPDSSQYRNIVKDDIENIEAIDHIILLIEDDANFAKTLIDQCHRKGFKCIAASTGEEGLQLALQKRPSAIILDIKLPVMDGWNVIESLKNNAKTRHIPVHMMSAFEETIEAYRKGAIGYLTKPVKPEDLDNAFGEIQHFIQKKMRELLLIEDDNNLRLTIRKIIGTSDIIITDVSTAKEALEQLHDHRYDCVVLDLGLPDMSGFELLKKLEVEKIKIPPVIVYTGRELTHEENEELHNYANSIIIKGVKSEERLLDETSLFLHRVIDDLPNKQKSIIINLYDKDKIFAGKNVLVVDDDMRNVFALTKVLEQIGINVFKADNGAKALQLLNETEKMDLVLMDIMMPVMDGYQAIAKIREQKQYAKLPVIALTAKAMKDDQAKCIEAGANDYIAKPVNLERLFSLMRVWLY